MNLTLDVRSQWPITDEQGMRIGRCRMHASDRADEVQRILMADQLRDLNNEGSAHGDSQRGKRVRPGGCNLAMNVDAVGYDVNAPARDSGALENRRNSTRDGDDRPGAAVFP